MVTKQRIKKYLLWFFCVTLSACVSFTPKTRTGEELNLPASYTLYEPQQDVSPDPWWTTLGSEELNVLMEEALRGNLTLSQIYARVEQMHLAAIQTGTSRFPLVSYSAETSTSTRRSTLEPSVDDLQTINQQLAAISRLIRVNNSTGFGGGDGLDQLTAGIADAQSRLSALETLFSEKPGGSVQQTTTMHSLGISASYEVDLWGRIKSAHEAALLDAQASQEDLFSAKLSLSGALASQWLTAAACRQEMELIAKQLELNKTTLELLELRYRKGMATALDVLQQRQIIAETEALLPPLEASLEAALMEIKVLAGKYPHESIHISTTQLPELPPLPELGLPADLLARRPDVRRAGLLLQAADWRLASARADRLPSLRLSASASYSTEDLALIFDNWMTKLAASIAGTLFDAGKKKAEVERNRAVVDERLANYRLTVLTAVKEVEDALMQERNQGLYIEALLAQVEVARSVHDQALQRYRNGLTSYLPVLTALSSVQRIERMLVRARLNQLLFRQRLYLALGGDWMDEGVV